MIIYFSGTGNTRHCAIRLAELLGESVHELSADELRDPASSVADTDSGRVIWAFPTYSWGMPPVVAGYMANAGLSDKARQATHYMLTTCGDDMGYTDRQWRRILSKRGLTTSGAYAVTMPNTYTLMKGFDVDSPELAQAKVAASAERMVLIAKAILEGGADMPIRGSFPRIKSSVIYPWFKRFAMSPKPFHTNAGCTACGLCSRVCPMGNISPGADGTPEWGEDCALCLRCYHSCPRRAICYGKATDGKGQWLLK